MIYLCLAHMSDDGAEQKYVKEAFDTNWVVPMGPNVNAFEKDLEEFANAASPKSSPEGKDFLIGNRYWRLRFVVEYARSMAFSSSVLSRYCLLTTLVCTVAVKPATSKVKSEEAVIVGEKAMVVVPTTESCPSQFQLIICVSRLNLIVKCISRH